MTTGPMAEASMTVGSIAEGSMSKGLMTKEVRFDTDRHQRIGLDEAVFAPGKSVAQLVGIAEGALRDGRNLLVTRLAPERFAEFPAGLHAAFDYCADSRTALLGPLRPVPHEAAVAVVCAGTSDLPVAREAARTLRHHGEAVGLFADVGVAGLWRLMDCLEAIRRHPVVVVVAGMDAALPTVLGGLIGNPLIAVPTSVGYGVASGGRAALDAMLASCAPGVAVVNIDNGYGAACAALRLLGALRGAGRLPEQGAIPANHLAQGRAANGPDDSSHAEVA